MEGNTLKLKISKESIFIMYKESLKVYIPIFIFILITDYFEISVFYVSLVVFFLEFLISLPLLSNYYNENKNTEVEFSETNIIIKNNENSTKINIEEIDQIRIFIAPSRARTIYHAMFMFNKFFYVRIRLKNRKDYFLTSLLDYMLDEKLIYLYPRPLIKKDDGRIYNLIEKVNN